MNEVEYRDYLNSELKRICGKYLEEGKKIPISNLHNAYNSVYKREAIYRFYVQDNKIYGYRFVNIYVENNKIFNTICTCSEYSSKKMCKHIAACLYYAIKEIIPRPLTQEEFSNNLLKSFKAQQKTNTIKEKMNLQLELDIYNQTFRLKLGVSKLYILSDSKLREFLNCYGKKEYSLGAKFIYDPNKHYFDQSDEELFKFLTSSPSQYSRNPSLSDRELAFLLDKLKDKTFELTNYGEIHSIQNGLPETITLDKQDNKYKLSINNIDKFYIPDEYSYKYIAYHNILYILSEDLANLLKTISESDYKDIIFEKKSLNLFKEGLLKKIKKSVTVAPNVDDIVIASKPESKIYVDFNKDKIETKVKFDYAGTIIDYFDKNDSIVRDEEEEQKVVDDILANDFIKSTNAFELRDIDDIGEFLENGLATLSEKYEVFTSKKIDATNFLKKQHVTSTFSIGMDGILSYSFNTDGINEDELSKIFTSLKNKKKYYRLKSGDLLKLDENEELSELNDVLNDLDLKISDFEEGSANIPKYRAFYIDSLKNNKYGIISTDYSFDKFINDFKKYKNIKIEFDEFDENTLRDYQKDGVKWLYTLYKCDLGGILADEMGLGKSIQTISLIKQILKEKKDAKILIVCPTSLVYNWKKEFDKFGSDLKYITVADNKTKRKEIINSFDYYNIFITSYGLIRNDNDEYEDKNFELCIIDEAQAIKNYQAGMTREIKKIKAHTKIALTGTPIENSVYELWSIFDFIMPGYLNSINSFRENYGIKDVDDESIEKLTKLNYLIKPFILRRKKKEVSKELPDKIENNIYLELPENQKALYMKIVKETEDEIQELISTSGFQAARFKILQLLTRLRQVVIDPAIIFDDYKGEAVKLERLKEIVKDLVADKHKILIFSSFKTVIHDVKSIFDKEGISNYVIEGEVPSKKRMELVEAFNKDDTSCFLITLKSGGTGLNLTAADIVIHLDIWWNPQAENQATDRAHRIGQVKNVTVIKLITKGTIEEKIIELQNKKKILSDNLIEGKNNSETISNLSEKEMKELLSYSQGD